MDIVAHDVLLDESVPIALTRLLTGHDARSVIYMEWCALKNGNLIARVEAAGFEMMVTADQGIRDDQSMTSHRMLRASPLAAPNPPPQAGKERDDRASPSRSRCSRMRGGG